MRTLRRPRRLIAATCLVVLLAGLSAQSASASLFGEYALQSSATSLVDSQLTDADDASVVPIPGLPASLVVAYGLGYIVGRALSYAVGATPTDDPVRLGQHYDRLDFSHFDPAT
jgi:hypothetical protein